MLTAARVDRFTTASEGSARVKRFSTADRRRHMVEMWLKLYTERSWPERSPIEKAAPPMPPGEGSVMCGSQ
jgi:hypothetical protein